MENQPSRPDQDRPETPDPHQPYQPTEPDTPDIQDPIIDGDNASQTQQRGAGFSNKSGDGRAPQEEREFVEGAIPPLSGDASPERSSYSGASNANQGGSNPGSGTSESGRFGNNGGFGSDELASNGDSRKPRDSGLGSDSSVGHDLDADEDTRAS